MNLALRRRSILPGFGLALGFTVFYLGLIVLIPLAGLVYKSTSLSWADFWETTTDAQVVAAYKLSFGASFVAAAANVVFGLILAWVLVRYRFPGRRIVDALIDLPFALPTAVAGIAPLAETCSTLAFRIRRWCRRRCGARGGGALRRRRARRGTKLILHRLRRRWHW